MTLLGMSVETTNLSALRRWGIHAGSVKQTPEYMTSSKLSSTSVWSGSGWSFLIIEGSMLPPFKNKKGKGEKTDWTD
jgi:hypothetical protein